MDAHNDDEKRLETAREAGKELDLFNAELSGTLSGYRAKHLPEGHASREDHRQRQAEKARAQTSALEALLANDPAYQAAHQRAMSTLQDMESRTESALVMLRRDMKTVSDTLTEMRGRGNVLPDGRKVYLDTNGNAFTEEGDRIEGPELEDMQWRADAPRYEHIRAERERAAELQRRETAILRYQSDVLGHARERLTDPDNPASREEVEKLDKLMKEQAEELQIPPMPEAVHQSGGPSFGSGMPKL